MQGTIIYITLLLDYLGAPNGFDPILLFKQPCGFDYKMCLIFLICYSFFCHLLCLCLNFMLERTSVGTLPFSIPQLYYILIWCGLNNCSQMFTSPLLLRSLFIADHWCVTCSAASVGRVCFFFYSIWLALTKEMWKGVMNVN